MTKALSSKVVVVTGASDGIGAAAARRLHADGHTVVVVGRSPDKTRRVAERIDSASFVADFADLAAVAGLAAALAERYPRIDVLANNAGGIFGPRRSTRDGLETTFQINHLAPFLLTTRLLPTLTRSRATVIQTSSIAARLYGRLDLQDLGNETGFRPSKAYGDTKLANILFTRELDTRYRSHGIDAVAFHPGVIASNFAADSTSLAMRLAYRTPFASRFLGTPDRGADQLLWLAETEPGPSSWQPGGYYEHGKLARRVNPQARDDDLAARLWDTSAALLAERGY